MNILILLLGASTTVALAFLGAFLWATRSGQFDDTVTPAQRILFDPTPADNPTPPTTQKHTPTPR